LKRLEGKSVIITDATAGIGETQAMIMASEGANIVCMGRDQSGINKIVSAICNKGGKAVGCLAKVEEAADCKRAAALAIEKFGRIDVLCNSFNIFDGFKKSLEQTEEGWNDIFRINVLGVFMMCNAVLPDMLSSGGGCLINLSAVAGLTGGAGGAAYTAARHAVVGYTKQLCVDYAEKGIRANAIAAGSVHSPILEKIFENDPSERVTIFEKIPSKTLGRAEDIAYLTVFLASDEARWINGAIICADGGRQALG
jgi:3-oxoacyl-[acyl-carrier protein] reductase